MKAAFAPDPDFMVQYLSLFLAKYEALLHELRTAITLGVRRLVALGDSELVVNQVMKALACRDPKMEAYCSEVRKLKSKFDGMELRHIPQIENEEVDSLARLGSTWDTLPSGAFLDMIARPSILLEAEREEPPKETTRVSQEVMVVNLD